MTYKLREKMNSEKGATLMTALLFFVVCAAVGSVVLTAATSASGRLAGLRKREQAHLAVLSAAEMFCDVMEKEQVVLQIEKKKENHYTTEEVAYLYKNIDVYTSMGTTNLPLLPGLVNKNYPTIKYDDAFPLSNDTIDDSAKTSFQITVNSVDDLSVSVSAGMTKALTLVVEFTKNYGSKPDEVETLKVTFRPVIEKKEVISAHQVNDTVNDTTDDRNTTHQKTYTIKWIEPVFE